MGVEVGAQAARSRALAVLRIRSRALAVALLPAAVAVVLLAATAMGHIGGGSWAVARWAVTVFAVLVLLGAAAVALVVARARPAMSPTVPITEASAPDLYRLVRDLADRLEVPAPSAIALTPDCDSWLEDRTHRAHGTPADAAEPGAGTGPDGTRTDLATPPEGTAIQGARPPRRRTPAAPVLVIGSPFLWWMRVGELRAVLAPVVAGTGPSAHPDIAAARRFVRGLDAAVAVASAPGRGPLTRTVLGGIGKVARLLLRSCRVHAAEMERGVAAAAAERAQNVDYGVRIVAQEQVGLAYAGWDRLLTRVALPAWRMGRWPSRLDAGVVSALTELSRRDRLAEGFASRLGERPACDLLEEPGAVDEAASLLAARLFHGGPAEPGPGWAPVAWQEYPDEVVDRKWRMDAARLHRVLDSLGVSRSSDPTSPDPKGPTLGRVLDHLTDPEAMARRAVLEARAEAAAAMRAGTGAGVRPDAGSGAGPDAGRPETGRADADVAEAGSAEAESADAGPAGTDLANAEVAGADERAAADPTNAGLTDAESADAGFAEADLTDAELAEAGFAVAADPADGADAVEGRGGELVARLSAELAREEAVAPPRPEPAGQGPDEALWDDGVLPLFPLQPPRSGRELLADHVTAMVCCAAVDTAGAAPGLDWLDGPSLLMHGERAADLTPRVLTLVEDGDPEPLRRWLARLGVRPEKPVRLV
ncbi:hypothetical protein [Streptomyces flavofungini]|uniref:Integral membrane protein n=1 Tax=Streptomyces flavofungini TaxID=68200 RepID=A0ABS0XHE9_9ACTN|nr:hypothetical protein [Streptomyces flavofungini]MBJ3812627.1 hypothetical protein [Streptomyces flavofungini]GHC87575.1 hypothetical protein GCM10010349_74270 [Streptomyces flavofungini]